MKCYFGNGGAVNVATRLDVAVLERGLAKSRTKARELIEKGNVSVNGKTIEKPSFEVNENDDIVVNTEENEFASRGGIKLAFALSHFGIDVNGLSALDIGASTGGFTDCLLKMGANKVCAVDVGHGQLVQSLLSDKRVVSMEGINARNLTGEQLPFVPDIVVMDVSFISQSLIYPAVGSILNSGGYLITLIKPQFEAGKKYIGKNGIVKDKKVYDRIIYSLSEASLASNMMLMKYVESPIQGGDGNTEFLGLFRKTGVDV